MFSSKTHFNPKGNTVRSTVWRGRRAVQAACLGLMMASGLTVVAAGPAYAASALVISTKAVSAPKGARGLCQQYSWACDRSSHGSVRGAANEIAIADRINRAVNSQVREISDQQQWRKTEKWSLPTARGGDCEDFALLKKRELMRAGVAPSKLLIATVLDRRRQAHAVLVLRTDRGDYVLDNLTNRMLPWQKTGYSFIRMQDPRSASGWTKVMRGGMFSS